MFITLEGIDRSGKSTQAELLGKALGPDTVLAREPGGTRAGERIREILKDPELALEPIAELLLFCAARAQLVRAVIGPALEAGHDVICDRFTDSTVAYQGIARELGAELSLALSTAATGGLEPDLTVLLRIPPERAAGRDGDGSDRFESEGLEFQRAVAAAYDELAARHLHRIVVVDADQAPEAVHEAVLASVKG